MAQTISVKYLAELSKTYHVQRAYVVNTTKAATVADDTDLISYKITNTFQNDSVIFGNTVGKYAEITMRNPNNILYNWVGDTVDLYFGLTIDYKLPTETIDYLKQGSFTVVNERKDTTNETVVFELYDNMTKFNTKYGGSNNFPQTLGSFAAELCAAAGLTLATPTFNNSTMVITSAPNVEVNEVTNRDMLGWLCELAIGNAVIGNNGQVYIKNFGATSIFTITPDMFKSLIVSPAFGPIDSTIYQFMPQNDIVFAPDPLPNNYNAFIITNNPIGYNQRASVVATIQPQINGFTYNPFNATWSGSGHLEFMDKITLEDFDGATYDTFVMNSTLEFAGSFSEVLNAFAYTPEQSEVKYGNSGKEWRRQTSLTVDKIKQEIIAVVSSIEGTDGIESRLDAAEIKLLPANILVEVKKQSGIANDQTLTTKSYVDVTAAATKIAAQDQIKNEYGETISDIQTNFIFDTSGLTISKSDSDFAVKISSSEMGFYDGPTKTAYVNGGEFYINKGNVVSSLTIGSHKIEKYSTGITIFRFVG